MSYATKLDHGFGSGQLYQNVSYRRRLYRSMSNIRSRMPTGECEWMQIGECFLLLEIFDANPLSLEDYDLFLKILCDEKVRWIGFNYEWDCTAFSAKYVQTENS